MTLTFEKLKARAKASMNRRNPPTEKSRLQRRIYENIRALREMDDTTNRLVATEMDKFGNSDLVYKYLTINSSGPMMDQGSAEYQSRFIGPIYDLLMRKMTKQDYNKFLKDAKFLKKTDRPEFTSGRLLFYEYYNLRDINYSKKNSPEVCDRY